MPVLGWGFCRPRVAGLVVEDEALVRDLTTRTLRAAGYTVHEADGGRAARELAAVVGQIDLLLADAVMPGESGPEVAREIARSHPGVRVLFMSGYAAEAISPRGSPSGAPLSS